VAEKVSTVRNPLTVIAIFAGIAEVSGTAVLPFITGENQHVYVWFLIGFPSGLVLLFFGTLLFKHEVLYAPSDFLQDETFLALIKGLRPASPEAVLEKKTTEAIQESNQPIEQSHAGIRGEPEPSPDTSTVTGPQSFPAEELQRFIAGREYKTFAQRNAEAEKLVLNLLQKEHGVVFQRETELTVGATRYVFDGVAIVDRGAAGKFLYAVEVRTIRHTSNRFVIKGSLRRLESYMRDLSADARAKILIIFAVVLYADALKHREEVEKEIRALVAESFAVGDLRFFTFESLGAASR